MFKLAIAFNLTLLPAYKFPTLSILFVAVISSVPFLVNCESRFVPAKIFPSLKKSFAFTDVLLLEFIIPLSVFVTVSITLILMLSLALIRFLFITFFWADKLTFLSLTIA